MAYPDKRERILNLFFNEPTKHWHFKNIVKNAKISEQRANFWLKKLVDERIIKRIKPRGKMPYYVSKIDGTEYKMSKKMFALNRMQDSGLLKRLSSLDAKTVVLFGSFSRSDWNSESDVDVFVYGNIKDFGTIWEGRSLEIHTCKTKKEIRSIRSGLMKNILKGYFIKGSVLDIAEVSI